MVCNPMSWPADPEILSLIADAIVSTDQDGNIILFNAAAEAMFGYGPEEVIGLPVEILMPLRVHRIHHLSLMNFADAQLSGGRKMGDRREVIGSRKNGDEFAVEATLSRWSVDGRPVLTAVIRDASERKRIDEARALLASEMAHRFKNAIAVVSSIVSLTARGARSVKAFSEALQGRLDALARTHDLLFQSGAHAADLRALVEAELSPYLGSDSENVMLTGPAVHLSSGVAVNLSLALHELATNAAKYGALSKTKGKVTIAWRIVDADTGTRLLLTWREAGGPPVSPPSRIGFGTELIKRCFGEGASIDYSRAGLHARIELPLEPGAAPSPAEAQHFEGAGLQG